MDGQVAKDCLEAFKDASEKEVVVYKPRGRKVGYKRTPESIAKQRETRVRNKLAKISCSDEVEKKG